MNLRKYIFLSVTFVALLLSFYSNFFHLIPQKSFAEFDIYNKGFVYGRIMNSEERGIFSDGCFSGIRYDTLKIHEEGKMNIDTIFFLATQRILSQKDMYLNKIEREPDFGPYYTQIGTMASVYSIINITLPGSPESKVNIYNFINALFNALVFTVFFWWISREFGIITSFVTLLFLLTSSYFIGFSGDIWWVAGSFYLPIFGLFVMMQMKLPEKKILINLFILFMIKAILTGFEFITCTFLSIFIPITYYYYYNRKTFKEFFTFSVKAGAVCCLALIILACLLVIQHKSYHGTFTAGLDWLHNAFIRRSGSEKDSEGILLNMGYIWGYYSWYCNAFDLSGLTSAIRIPFTIVITTVYINLFVLFRLTRKAIDKRRYTALILATVLSYIPSISWYIIFRDHAWKHLKIDAICWYFPFLLLGFISIGVTISILYKRFYTKSVATE